jgi:DUF1365 family protein
MRSHLLEGVVRHRRAHPFSYELEHRVFYVALDLDELDEVPRRVRFIGRNRANLLTFRDADHFEPPARDLRETVLAHLRESGVDASGWRFTLITNLRVLGYVFNPASFYLCRDPQGALQVVIVEVHNTHGERHLYTLRPQTEGPTFVASMDKAFYVSPFIDPVGAYAVRVRDEDGRLRITINESKDGQLQLHASLDLARRSLSSRSVARMLVRYPLVTHRTIGMIHLHAARLWRRGARFYRHGQTAS